MYNRTFVSDGNGERYHDPRTCNISTLYACSRAKIELKFDYEAGTTQRTYPSYIHTYSAYDEIPETKRISKSAIVQLNRIRLAHSVLKLNEISFDDRDEKTKISLENILF